MKSGSLDLQRTMALYNNLINDPDFDMIEMEIDKPNIFEILSVTTNELRHSNMLAWLLNPNANHGLNDKFLKRFLRFIFLSAKFKGILPIDVESINHQKIKVHREWRNIDIVIEYDYFVVAIENKILSGEHSNQLTRYREIIHEHFPEHEKIFIYLTPDGDHPENENDASTYEPLPYVFIADTLKRLQESYWASLDSTVRVYLNNYERVIRRQIMKSDEATLLAQQIYNNHREILDFILENRPDETMRVRELLESLCREHGWKLTSPSKTYVRFIPPAIDHLIYRNKHIKNGWRDNEVFALEFRLDAQRNKITFKSVVAPTDPDYDRDGLIDRLNNIPGSKIPKGKQWSAHFSKTFTFDFENAGTVTDDELLAELSKIINKIEPTVLLIEEEILR
jgi:hypothetical protein